MVPIVAMVDCRSDDSARPLDCAKPTMPPTLACDTSSPTLFIALSNSAGQVFERDYNPGPTGARTEKIGFVVEELSIAAGLTLDSIERLILGSGPGSFTGLRIGAAFMKGLSWSLKIPLLQISSLRAYAQSFVMSDHAALKVATVLDAGRDELFAALYRKQADLFIEELAPSIQPRDQFLNRAVNAGYQLIGFHRDASNLGIVAPSGVGQGLLKIAAAEHPVAQFSLPELAQQEPLYLRAVSARTIAERKLT